MSKPKKNDDEKLIHDTEVLLQKYRQVKWALDVAANKEMRELKHETGITEEYLHAAVFAGADISNTSGTPCTEHGKKPSDVGVGQRKCGIDAAVSPDG